MFKRKISRRGTRSALLLLWVVANLVFVGCTVSPSRQNLNISAKKHFLAAVSARTVTGEVQPLTEVQKENQETPAPDGECTDTEKSKLHNQVFRLDEALLAGAMIVEAERNRRQLARILKHACFERLRNAPSELAISPDTEEQRGTVKPDNDDVRVRISGPALWSWWQAGGHRAILTQLGPQPRLGYVPDLRGFYVSETSNDPALAPFLCPLQNSGCANAVNRWRTTLERRYQAFAPAYIATQEQRHCSRPKESTPPSSWQVCLARSLKPGVADPVDNYEQCADQLRKEYRWTFPLGKFHAPAGWLVVREKHPREGKEESWEQTIDEYFRIPDGAAFLQTSQPEERKPFFSSGYVDPVRLAQLVFFLGIKTQIEEVQVRETTVPLPRVLLERPRVTHSNSLLAGMCGGFCGFSAIDLPSIQYELRAEAGSVLRSGNFNVGKFSESTDEHMVANLLSDIKATFQSRHGSLMASKLPAQMKEEP